MLTEPLQLAKYTPYIRYVSMVYSYQSLGNFESPADISMPDDFLLEYIDDFGLVDWLESMRFATLDEADMQNLAIDACKYGSYSPTQIPSLLRRLRLEHGVDMPTGIVRNSERYWESFFMVPFIEHELHQAA